MNPQQPGAPYPQPPMPQPQFPVPAPAPVPPMPAGTGPDDPYRFIMDPPKKTKATGGGISQSPFVRKILFLAGGAVLLMIIAGFLINIFFGDKTNVQTIVSLAQQEQEIIRISGKITDSTSQGTKNAAINTQATITTHQQEWLIFLGQRKRKVPVKELSMKQDLSTDRRLAQAAATSTYDLAFKQVVRSQLEAYAAALKDAHANATGSKEKALLAEDYNEVQILLEQWPKPTGQ